MAAIDTTLSVTGMTCGSCVRRIQAALGRDPRVIRVDVDLGAGLVHVRHAETVSEAALREAVRAAGFGA